jgi:dienelactone hydrolase
LAALLLAAAFAGAAPHDASTAGAGAIEPTYVVAERVMTFVDHSRFIALPGHQQEPRTLVTVVRYPLGVPRPVGLVVFGHGFAVTPAYYFGLLRAWAQAGFVVAAPVFPLGNKWAPGGPDENDIVNQPRDMSFVISRLLAASARPGGPLSGLIDPGEIAVAGQSDGGSTALAAAYDSAFRDRRVRAAVVLSGAELGIGGYFKQGGPPLLAFQGTADTMNEPRYTYAYFNAARRPKYLLRLLGAGHLPPYTFQQPQLSIVERVSIDFLERYLYGSQAAGLDLATAGNVRRVATLTADPSSPSASPALAADS